MVQSPRPGNLDISTLANLFCRTSDCIGQFEEVDSAELPERFSRLLDHHDHMTVAQESAHTCPVAVEVLERRVTESHYLRKSLLRRTSDNRVVQYCTVRLNLEYLGTAVSEAVQG